MPKIQIYLTFYLEFNVSSKLWALNALQVPNLFKVESEQNFEKMIGVKWDRARWTNFCAFIAPGVLHPLLIVTILLSLFRCLFVILTYVKRICVFCDIVHLRCLLEKLNDWNMMFPWKTFVWIRRPYNKYNSVNKNKQLFQLFGLFEVRCYVWNIKDLFSRPKLTGTGLWLSAHCAKTPFQPSSSLHIYRTLFIRHH